MLSLKRIWYKQNLETCYGRDPLSHTEMIFNYAATWNVVTYSCSHPFNTNFSFHKVKRPARGGASWCKCLTTDLVAIMLLRKICLSKRVARLVLGPINATERRIGVPIVTITISQTLRLKGSAVAFVLLPAG